MTVAAFELRCHDCSLTNVASLNHEYIAYLENRIHVIGEYLFIQHHNDSTSWTGNTQSAFLELGYDTGIFGPYVRGEIARFPGDTATNDPFFAQNALFLTRGSSKSGVVGVRSFVSCTAPSSSPVTATDTGIGCCRK